MQSVETHGASMDRGFCVLSLGYCESVRALASSRRLLTVATGRTASLDPGPAAPSRIPVQGPNAHTGNKNSSPGRRRSQLCADASESIRIDP